MRFLLAMTLYPDAQKKAQGEIDRVVGNARLPTYDECVSTRRAGRAPLFLTIRYCHSRKDLPYIDALLKEVYRYEIETPLSLPRILGQDEVYNGDSKMNIFLNSPGSSANGNPCVGFYRDVPSEWLHSLY